MGFSRLVVIAAGRRVAPRIDKIRFEAALVRESLVIAAIYPVWPEKEIDGRLRYDDGFDCRANEVLGNVRIFA